MADLLNSEAHLRAGDPAAALKALQDEVRAKPADAKKRVFLFQLLCVLGQWERALNQLNVAAELDPSTLAMAQTYREAIKCELLRAQVFEGRKVPMLFGEPEPWIALLLEALLREGQGQAADARALRDQAFEQAPAGTGKLGETPFAWIADADMRLGPVLEVIINGKYYWVPFARLAKLTLEAPADLRDAVWMPAHLQFENGGETVGLIPTRYAGSESAGDGLLALSRKTVWQEPSAGFYVGSGQRVLTTDGGDVPLMDVRSIEWDLAPADTSAETPATE
ncbi:type VI secretion system accessory protein TagJ [Caldimonas brevitalea]|uniref:Virulence protein SciE type n=1 Tax=Caldimonas brevitalea TaxID=413882 RepID=A0A0G3BHG4_9BURK|nr:type VI secretion system accessory protein TagJ [Caldimonas brevitalea]AKJ28874.1 virulence protein SciE type [Caldimonas brevitalea]